MRAGNLDRRITLQRASVAQNGLGEEIETWADLATVWAEKIESRRLAKEQSDAGEARQALRRRTFRIRWSSGLADLNARDRVIFDGQACDILGVTELGRREGLEIETLQRAD